MRSESLLQPTPEAALVATLASQILVVLPQITVTVNQGLAFPEKLDGTPTKCKDFLMQCSIFIAQQPMLCPTEESKIAFVCSLLMGKVLDWAMAVWGNLGPNRTTFSDFIQWLREVFKHLEGERVAENSCSRSRKDVI